MRTGCSASITSTGMLDRFCEALVTAYQLKNDAAVMARLGLSQPYLAAEFNVVLPKAGR